MCSSVWALQERQPLKALEASPYPKKSEELAGGTLAAWEGGDILCPIYSP